MEVREAVAALVRRLAHAAPVVPVLPVAAVRGWPDHDEGARAQYLSLPEALRRTWRGDAHFAGYSVPAVARRLTKRALDPARLPDGVAMVAWIVDVDDPATHAHNAAIKRARRQRERLLAAGASVPGELEALASRSTIAATDAWREDFAGRVAQLLEAAPEVGAYQTRGGGRVVAWLRTPRVLRTSGDAGEWARWHACAMGWLARRFGIVADPLSREWSRLFRLPRATRDGAPAPESWPVHALPSSGWSFTPSPADVDALRALADAAEPHRAENAGRNTWREALHDVEPAPLHRVRPLTSRPGPGHELVAGPAHELVAPAPSRPSPAPADGRAWVDAAASRPCPVCGGASWCQTARDGATVLCKRVSSARGRVNRAGVEFYIHHLADRPGARVARSSSSAPTAPSVQRAEAVTLDAGYRALLGALTLDATDLDALRARGLTDAAIAEAGYRTLPAQGRARLARVVFDALGDAAVGVPGVVQRAEAGRSWWSIAGVPGVVIPCRDLAGRIVALKVRRREAGEGPRYLYLTSARAGGPAAACVLHVPVRARAILETAGPVRLVVTEGELKADVASELLGAPVVSVPGVGAWRMAVEAARTLRPRSVAVALDADARTNRTVAGAQRSLVDALRAEGHRVELWTWPARFKGLDDYCAAARRGEV